MLFSFSCVSDFKKLHVWQKAHALSLCVDRVCKQIRGSRYASLRSQLFRAATSIPANIAEGRRQESEEDDFRSLVTQTIRVRKMLYALLKCLSNTDRTPPPPAYAHKTARPEPKADPPTAPGR